MKGWKEPQQWWNSTANVEKQESTWEFLHDFFWLKKLKTTRNELFWFRQGMIFRFQPRVDYISKEWYPRHLSRDPSWFPIVFEVTNKLHFGSWAESLHQLFFVHWSFHWTRLWHHSIEHDCGNNMSCSSFHIYTFIQIHSIHFLQMAMVEWFQGLLEASFFHKIIFLRNQCVERCWTTITGKEDNPLHISTGSPDFFHLDCWASQFCLYFHFFEQQISAINLVCWNMACCFASTKAGSNDHLLRFRVESRIRQGTVLGWWR